jgi:hypothetical protein
VSHDGEHDPMVVVVDRVALAWTKMRPTAGMVPPVEHLTIAPRPDGGVALFGWVATLGMVAARMWADDSNAFGDFEVFAPGACEGLSAASAPGVGWVVACSAHAGSRAERLREDATVAWGPTGVPVGSGSATAPLALAFDSASSLLLVERAAAVGGDRWLAFRYGARDGSALWAAPVQLGVAASPISTERVGARAVREGLVRVTLAAGSVAARDRRRAEADDVASDGGVAFAAASRPASGPPRSSP